MSPQPTRRPHLDDSEGGWGFVELIAAVAIVGTALLIMLQQMSISYRETGFSHDRVFAYQKAIAMMAEIQSAVERGELPDANALEGIDDHDIDNPVLTTLAENGVPVVPDHLLSGNVRREGDWIWWRTVSVEAVPSSELMRYVRIRVRAQLRGGSRVTAASIGTVIHLPTESFPATQVYDVYALAIAEAPSLWRPIEQMRSALSRAVSRLESANPGLEYRVHWITSLGYGRDPRYVPYLNTAKNASQRADWAYTYPSRIDDRSRLFTPELFSGRVQTDVEVLNDYDPTEEPVPHAVADRFNHCVRAPAARRIQLQRVGVDLESVDEPPLQILLEDMAATPERFRNALFVNLHGEALPCPPLRNYSDAAKDPVNHPGVRVVTHPERLWNPRDPNGDGDHTDTGDVRFRVYSYKTDPSKGATTLSDPITLQILGVDLSQNVNGRNPGVTTLCIDCLPGGVDRGGALSGDLTYSPFAGAKHASDAPEPNEMYYEIGFDTTPIPHTWIRLYNSPLVAPPVALRGLTKQAQLYGMEYVPSPIANDDSFSVDLSTLDSGTQPKNTARWRITVPKDVFLAAFPGGSWSDVDTMLDVTTRIGTDTTTGVMWPVANAPTNLSETFTWWSQSKEIVPTTERYQFLGDPRHYPYGDGVAAGDGFAHGYNWHFSDLKATKGDVDPAHWPCLDFDRLADGGFDGNVVDEPRLLQVWREALVRSGAVFQHTEGLIAGSTVIGGEISSRRLELTSDPAPVSLAGELFNATEVIAHEALVADPGAGASAPGGETAGKGGASAPERFGRTIVVDRGSDFWVQHWLGELAPDDYTAFESTGNLSTTRFHHELRADADLANLALGIDFAFPSGSRSGPLGVTALIHANAMTGGPVVAIDHGKFEGKYQGNALELVTAASSLHEHTTYWRWGFDFGGSFVEPAYWGFTDSYPAHFLSLYESLGVVGDFSGGEIVALTSPANETGFLSFTGVLVGGNTGHSKLLERSLLMAQHAFYVAGEPSRQVSVEALPSVVVIEPKPQDSIDDPSAIAVRWRTNFARYDGESYTPNYGAGYSGSEVPLSYVVMVSSDDGETWHYAEDGSEAVPGRWLPSTSPYLLPDAGVGDESFVVPTPAGRWPAGDYLFRVEAHHTDRQAHYCCHEQTITILR